MTGMVWLVRWLAATPRRVLIGRRAEQERAIRDDIAYFRGIR